MCRLVGIRSLVSAGVPHPHLHCVNRLKLNSSHSVPSENKCQASCWQLAPCQGQQKRVKGSLTFNPGPSPPLNISALSLPFLIPHILTSWGASGPSPQRYHSLHPSWVVALSSLLSQVTAVPPVFILQVSLNSLPFFYILCSQGFIPFSFSAIILSEVSEGRGEKYMCLIYSLCLWFAHKTP